MISFLQVASNLRLCTIAKVRSYELEVSSRKSKSDPVTSMSIEKTGISASLYLRDSKKESWRMNRRSERGSYGNREINTRGEIQHSAV